jgi:hypothetical protein
MKKIIILIPIFEDFDCLEILMQEIDQSIGGCCRYTLVVVDDGSFETKDFNKLETKKTEITIITLSQNVGNQRCITLGLCYISELSDFDYVIVMDGDGEDNPKYTKKLIEAAIKSENENIIFARRDVRKETFLFKMGYFLYRILFVICTGRKIKFGNFSIIPKSILPRLTGISQIWNHFAAGIIHAKIPYVQIASKRAGRIKGRTKMNFISLALHGFNGISVFIEIFILRLLIFSSILFTIGISIKFAYSILDYSTVIYPISNEVFIAWLLFKINLFVALIYVLNRRIYLPFIPRNYWRNYIKNIRILRILNENN